MLGKLKDLELAGEFTVQCSLSNNSTKTLTFTSTSSAKTGNTDLFVKASFFGGDGSYLIKNRFEVLVNICLGLPVNMNLADCLSIVITPNELQITNPKPHIPTPLIPYNGQFMDEHELLVKSLEKARENVFKLEKLLNALEQSN